MVKKNDAIDAALDNDNDLPPSFENDLNEEEDFQISAYPNPASSEINISFELPAGAELVKIKIADIKGFVYRELPLNNLNEGQHSVQMNVADLDKGQYVYVVEIDGQAFGQSFTKQ